EDLLGAAAAGDGNDEAQVPVIERLGPAFGAHEDEAAEDRARRRARAAPGQLRKLPRREVPAVGAGGRQRERGEAGGRGGEAARGRKRVHALDAGAVIAGTAHEVEEGGDPREGLARLGDAAEDELVGGEVAVERDAGGRDQTVEREREAAGGRQVE